MTFRTRYCRKAPSSPELQGLFFDKAMSTPAFFNPTHQSSERTTGTLNHSPASSVVQKQEGAGTSPKPEEEKPVQKMAKEEEKPVQKMATEEEKPVQKQAMEEEKPVQKMAKEEEKPVQKQAMEEEKPVQKMAKEEEKPVQKKAMEEEKPVQKQNNSTEKKPQKPRVTAHPSQSDGEQEHTTGLPDRLKMRIEALSGISMDDVKVHYNSPKPAQMKALAFTQGTDIYLAPGQEQHLPHEVWHVVQQKQGRVEPTVQTKGVGVNDDPGLEQEATAMGQKATAEHSAVA
jgi:Domain of unknown function (DUF4157)